MFCLIVYLVCLCSVTLLNGFVLLTCFHHNHFLLHSTHALMSRLQLSNLIGENPPGVLSEVATCRCAPLNQCDTKSSSDGISMIIATTLFMYQLDYNKLKLSHTSPDDNILLELCYNLWTWFYVCMYLLFSSYYSGTFHIFHSLFFDISLWPCAWSWFLTCL